ncbi:MAG: hypothetical protein R3213_01930 [Flavobacteriaceae bacterium]|nr:hypothetical protein [Flavobacteriaceae bacterium]
MAKKPDEQKFKYKGYNVSQIRRKDGNYVYKVGNRVCPSIRDLDLAIAALKVQKSGTPIKPTQVHKDKSKYTRKKKHKKREN